MTTVFTDQAAALHFVIARDRNVLRVDFHRDPDPPAPRFPGAGALRGLQPAEPVDAFREGIDQGRAA